LPRITAPTTASRRFAVFVYVFRSKAWSTLKEPNADLVYYTPEEFEERRKKISIVSKALKYRVEL